jgi:hypothetical protein
MRASARIAISTAPIFLYLFIRFVPFSPSGDLLSQNSLPQKAKGAVERSEDLPTAPCTRLLFAVYCITRSDWPADPGIP